MGREWKREFGLEIIKIHVHMYEIEKKSIFKIYIIKGMEPCSVAKSIYGACGGPGFGPQYLHDGSQLSVTPGLGNLINTFFRSP